MPKKNRKRKHYPDEFKAEAVRLVLERGDRTVGEIAESLGVNEHRPSQALRGRTPAEVYEAREPAADQAIRAPKTGRDCGKRVELAVSYLEGRNHLPIVELRAAA